MLPLQPQRIAVRVARAEVGHAQLGIDGGRAPDGAAAGPPHLVVRPGLESDVVRSGNGVKAPHLGAGARVERADPAPPAAVAARERDQQHAVGVGRRRGNPQGHVVGGIPRERMRPLGRAVRHVEGMHRAAGARHQDVAEIGGDRQAAPRGRLRQLGDPRDRAGLRVERGHVAVHQRREDPAVRHRKRGLVGGARKPGRPRAAERSDVARGDLRQRRIALVRGGAAVQRPLAARPRALHAGRPARPFGRRAAGWPQRCPGRRGRVRPAGERRLERRGCRRCQGRRTEGHAVRVQDVGRHVRVGFVAERAGVARRHRADGLDQIVRRPPAPARGEGGAGQRRRVGPAGQIRAVTERAVGLKRRAARRGLCSRERPRRARLPAGSRERDRGSRHTEECARPENCDSHAGPPCRRAGLPPSRPAAERAAIVLPVGAAGTRSSSRRGCAPNPRRPLAGTPVVVPTLARQSSPDGSARRPTNPHQESTPFYGADSWRSPGPGMR